MPYRFKRKEKIPHGVRRIVTEQTECDASELTGGHPDIHDGVHNARHGSKLCLGPVGRPLEELEGCLGACRIITDPPLSHLLATISITRHLLCSRCVRALPIRATPSMRVCRASNSTHKADPRIRTTMIRDSRGFTRLQPENSMTAPDTRVATEPSRSPMTCSRAARTFRFSRPPVSGFSTVYRYVAGRAEL